ncbi:hypothetical protein DPMN_157961 [Dreissena polymorpha]|uniref:Uncharacterized protein n=1 Tax=Dreissena polymorpha TaxID=45954 RepID=A0A9D4EI73_DREPO|nr:hypothetical protein DPMN_157961 [Dreissena polymorpha]
MINNKGANIWTKLDLVVKQPIYLTDIMLGSARDHAHYRHEGVRETALKMGSDWSDLNAVTVTMTMTGYMATLSQSMELHKITETDRQSDDSLSE